MRLINRLICWWKGHSHRYYHSTHDDGHLTEFELCNEPDVIYMPNVKLYKSRDCRRCGRAIP